MIIQKTFFAALFSLLIIVSSQAMHRTTDNPMFPIPFSNDFIMLCCHQNAFLQCLFQCPKFCRYINQIENPKNDLCKALKMLQYNRFFMFKNDENILLPFFQYHYTYAQYNNWIEMMARWSAPACSYMHMYFLKFHWDGCDDLGMDSLNMELMYEYIFLKQIFALRMFYYSDQNRVASRLKKVEFVAKENRFGYVFDGQIKPVTVNSLGFDFFYVDVPKLDLFIVKRSFSLPTRTNLTLDDCNTLNSMILALEMFFSSETKKDCKLGAVFFATKKTLDFIKKPGCDPYIWQQQLECGTVWAGNKLSDLVAEVREVHSDEFVHCASYVKHKNEWYFCDDFFRACLKRPLLRKIQGGVKDVFRDLVVNEQGGDELLFFWTNS